MKKISIIVPCYNEEKTIKYFHKEIMEVFKNKTLNKLEKELIFIDDGSTDQTLNEIKKLEKVDNIIKYISFSRNFGKEAAMLAGLEHSTGDYIAIMDVDLQDPPSLLIEMYNIITNEKIDCVATRRVNRIGEPPIRSFFARMFYKLINKISRIEMVDGARDYRLMTKRYVEALISMKEYNRYSKGLFSFVGFETKWLEFENVKRIAGETKWSFWKLVVYAIDGITAFSTVPLVISGIFGIILCFISFLAILFIIAKTLIFGDPTSGWPSMVCIIMFVGGLQLLSIGIMGEYLAKTYLETKNRPIYIIKEKEGISK